MDFRNKVAVVTGASGNVGIAVVEAFLVNGATVAGVDRETTALTDRQDPKAAGRIKAFSADVTKEDEVRTLFKDIAKQLGGVDFLVHTVGGFKGGTKLNETSFEDWEKMQTLNVRSAFLCSKYALRHMEKRGGGKIITISAMAALEPKANRAAYLVAKAGVVALTRAIAVEGKKINVQANAVAPSIILTEANKKAMPDMDHSEWVKPEDIGETIVHLCSPASASITDTVIKML